MKAFGSKLFAKGGKRPTSASSSPAAVREAASQGEGSDSPLSPMRDDPSTEPAAGSPPPPMWANRKPPGGESGGGSGGGGGPPPPMWGNTKPAASTSSSMGTDYESSLSSPPVVRHTP